MGSAGRRALRSPFPLAARRSLPAACHLIVQPASLAGKVIVTAICFQKQSRTRLEPSQISPGRWNWPESAQFGSGRFPGAGDLGDIAQGEPHNIVSKGGGMVD